MKPFPHPTPGEPSAVQRPSCAECRAPLTTWVYWKHPKIDPDGVKQFGYMGNNIFCTLRCGFKYAVNTIKRKGRQ